jgi:microcystin degradation protein MlrC
MMLRDEALWAVPLLSPDAAVVEAMRLSASAHKPIVIADTQDNPGAGADSNTTGMLRALLDNGAQDAALGLIWDPEAAAQAHAAGLGARIELALGGRSGTPGDTPFVGTFEVVALSDGRCRYDGPMMHGLQVELGPVACLAIDGVRIAVSSTKAQMLDRNLYRVAGIEPEAMKILVNKSSVHFRADFEPIAHAVLVAKAPGPMTADPADLPWTRLAQGIRVRPMGEPFTG